MGSRLRTAVLARRRSGRLRGVTALAAAVLGGASLCLGAPASGAAASGLHHLKIYSVATGVQYINNQDDEVRGSVNNPFNSQTAKLQPKLSLKGNGPFPGDVTVYTFDLYSSAQLQKKVGSAAYTCYFNYASHALCLAYYELSGPKGSLVASGSLDFAQTGFTLVVTGGTLHYLGASGELGAVSTVAAGKSAQRLSILYSQARPSSATAIKQRLQIDSVPVSAQFMNHADDRIRGMTNNPFDVYARALVILTKGSEKGNGPFPGDDVLYSFKLYQGATAKKAAGSAIFTCYYDFLKHATCDAYFELKDGVLLGSGAITFEHSRFTLDVTGGTGPYLGAQGEIVATPGTPHSAEHLSINLT